MSRSVATAEAKEQQPAKLLVRPRPDRGESLLGYIHRIGELNGLTSLNWIASMLSEVGVLGIPDHKLLVLAESIGMNSEDLSNLTSRPKATKMANILLFMDAYVPDALFRKHRSAICVECLRERDATPAVWDLRLICACVRHRRWLIDTCPKCCRALSWRREFLLRCQCGNDLTRSLQNDYEPPEIVLIFTRALEGELRNELPFDQDASARFPRFMTGRLVADSITAFQRARRYVERWHGHVRLEVPESTSKHRIDMAAVLNLSQVLIDWPTSLHAEIRRRPTTLLTKDYEYPLISEKKFLSVITPLGRLPHKFKEILGRERLKKAYRRFCEQHEFHSYGRGMMLNPKFTRTMPDGSWAIQPHLSAVVEAYEPYLLRSASDSLRRRRRHATIDSACAASA